MDSTLDVLMKLIEEGKSFTFENFSTKIQKNNFKLYAGEETRAWIIFKKRVKNLVEKYAKENSPAQDMIRDTIGKDLTGCMSADFNKVKADIVTSLNLLHENMKEDIYAELVDSRSGSINPKYSNRVLIVYGDDEQFKDQLVKFLVEIGLEPIVSNKYYDGEGTIADKFDNHDDIGFVFVLLTADDILYNVDQSDVSDKERLKIFVSNPDVLYKFGYSTAKLGSNRVCCLYKGEVTVPTHLSGVAYRKVIENIDEQAYPIIKEMKGVGYKINV